MTPKQKKQLLKQANPQPKTYTEQELIAFGESLILSYLASSLISLRDVYGFGKERMEKFLAKESAHAQAIKNGYVTSGEILEQIKVETGFDLQEFIQNRYKEMEEKQ